MVVRDSGDVTPLTLASVTTGDGGGGCVYDSPLLFGGGRCQTAGVGGLVSGSASANGVTRGGILTGVELDAVAGTRANLGKGGAEGTVGADSEVNGVVNGEEKGSPWVNVVGEVSQELGRDTVLVALPFTVVINDPESGRSGV